MIRCCAQATALLCLAACVFGGEQAPEAQDPAALQEQLRRTVGELRQLREDYYARKQEQEKRLDELTGQIDSLDREKAELAATKASLQARTDEVARQAAELRASEKKHDALRAGVGDALKGFVAAQRAAIEHGPPHRVEQRLELLHRLERDLASRETGLATLVELAWVFAEGELRDAAEGAAYTADVALPDGRKKPARFCHLGHVLVGFVTEDGQECGVAVPARAPRGNEWSGGFRWLLESEDSSAGVIRDAVRILDRREPPRLLLLPLLQEKTDSHELTRSTTKVKRQAVPRLPLSCLFVSIRGYIATGKRGAAQ